MIDQSIATDIGLDIRRATEDDIPALTRLLAVCTHSNRLSGAVRGLDASRLLIGVQYKQVDGWVVERDGRAVFAALLCRTLPGPAESGPAPLADLRIYALAENYSGEHGVGLERDEYMLALMTATMEAARVSLELECQVLRVAISYRGAMVCTDLDSQGAMKACGLMPDSYVFSGTVEQVVTSLERHGINVCG